MESPLLLAVKLLPGDDFISILTGGVEVVTPGDACGVVLRDLDLITGVLHK